MTLTVRRAAERGHADHGWLNSWHTFSFADYYDPAHMGFRALRVINDDTVAAGGGFPRHAHRDMEIISYVLDGALEHKDSMGTGSVIRPGDVQRMSAGTGVQHSEYNASKSESVHFLQIWIIPDRPGHPPGYEQKTFAADAKRGALRLVASPDGADGSVTIHQDAKVYAALIAKDDLVSHSIDVGRHAWIHVAKGAIAIDDLTLGAGDAVATSDPGRIGLRGAGDRDAEVLVFDLA
jgi:hypothetical protein